MPNSVELVGEEAAMADLRRWADQLGPAIDKDSRAFAGRVASKVSGRVPVLTGALAASVDIEDTPGDDGAGVSIGEGLEYAGWIEFGGSRGRAYIPEGRYLYPTALAAEGDFRQLAEHTATDTVARYPWSKAP